MNHRPHSDADAPSVNPGVLKALRTIDPGILVTWSKWNLDVTTGKPIIGPDGEPILSPGWYIWRHNQDTGEYLFIMHKSELDHRLPKQLEADDARHYRIKEIVQRHKEAEKKRQEREKKAQRERRLAMLDNNAGVIDEIRKGKRNIVRKGKTFSYPGGYVRRTPGNVPNDDGWKK